MTFDRRPHRKLLGAAPSAGDGGRSRAAGENFDTNMVVILAALLCALICALGINSIVRYVLRCVRAADSGGGGRVDGDEPGPRRRGVQNKGLLRRIPVRVYGSGERVGSTDCPICLAEFVDGEKIRVLPECRHCFHARCVDVWLTAHASCPTCRRVLVAETAGNAPAIGDAPATAAGAFSDEVG
ncbi:RING-H2 finger protein ATL74-like [Andrographis paniculata]|uniref:RING-H2 finger protein ATL74-like n=1 Tax=Andrographis paniculata TaxID=175694 RepID=UPI0021E9191F|nr:RING-H2 finger protein ATL74-like [Andrographis paniculata]